MRQPNGVPSGQRSDRFRQFLRARHVCVTHQHRDHPLVLFQGRFDLDADEILGTIKASGALIVTSVDPALTDHGEQCTHWPTCSSSTRTKSSPGAMLSTSMNS